MEGERLNYEDCLFDSLPTGSRIPLGDHIEVKRTPTFLLIYYNGMFMYSFSPVSFEALENRNPVLFSSVMLDGPVSVRCVQMLDAK